MSSIDIELDPIEQNLYPLLDVTNLEGLYLVNFPNSEVIYSNIGNQNLKSLSNAIFNVEESGESKSAEQVAFEESFFILFYEDSTD